MDNSSTFSWLGIMQDPYYRSSIISIEDNLQPPHKIDQIELTKQNVLPSMKIRFSMSEGQDVHSNFDRKRSSTWAAFSTLWVVRNAEWRADKFCVELHMCSTYQRQRDFIHHHLAVGFTAKDSVIWVGGVVKVKLILEAWAASALHHQPQHLGGVTPSIQFPQFLPAWFTNIQVWRFFLGRKLFLSAIEFWRGSLVCQHETLIQSLRGT